MGSDQSFTFLASRLWVRKSIKSARPTVRLEWLAQIISTEHQPGFVAPARSRLLPAMRMGIRSRMIVSSNSFGLIGSTQRCGDSPFRSIEHYSSR